MRSTISHVGVVATILSLGGCSTKGTTTEPDDSIPGVVSTRVTLAHHYPVPTSWKEFMLRVRLEQEAKAHSEHTLGGGSGVQTAPGCGDDEMLRDGGPPDENASMSIQSSPVAQQLGTIHVYASNPNDPGPTWLVLGAFAVPERALELPCDWGGSGYGSVGSVYTQFVVDVFGQEEVDDPPAEPPPGMSTEDYNALNPAEKRLVWKYFLFIPELIQARSEAESWAPLQTSEGPHNGPQDALRHAYWQCRLTKLTSVGIAMEWGDAHEKYSTAYAEVRMDLFNNRIGRLAGLDAAPCAETILDAWQSGRLALGPMAGPNQHPLGGGTPPPPPEYAQ